MSTRQPSSNGPPFAPPAPQAAASLASTSVVVMIGDVYAVSGGQAASLAVDIDLWRCSQKRHQQACERRSADAKRSINEGFAGVRKMWDPSS